MRILLNHRVLDQPGGILFQGMVGVHRDARSRGLIFTAVFSISYDGNEDPCLAGKSLRWTEMSGSPEEFGKYIMEQISMMENFIKVAGHTVQIQDFLSTLAGGLFDAALRLNDRATRNRECKAHEALRELAALSEEAITIGCNLEDAAIEATA